MTLSHLFEHIEPLEKSGRVAQAVGMVDASLEMQSARLETGRAAWSAS